MTKNYIEIIKRSPYYYQVDGMRLEQYYPEGVYEEGDVWQAWRQNLPEYYEKEKVFLGVVALEDQNPRSFVDTVRWIRPALDKEFLEFVEKEKDTIAQIYADETPHHFLIPSEQYYVLITENLKQYQGVMETVCYFFLRTALQYFGNDWTATRMCFHNLVSGKTLLGLKPYTKHQCFTAETEVWTTEGVKQISEVRVGDYVPTHNGRFCRVLRTLKNPRNRRRLYEVHHVLGRVAVATDDHPFLVYHTGYKQMVWKNVEELDARTDFLMRSTLTGLHSFHLFSPLKEYPVLNKFVHQHPRVIGVAMSRVMGNDGIVDMKHHMIKDCLENLAQQELTIYEDIIIHLTDIKIRMILWKWALETNHYLLVRGWWDAFQSQTLFDNPTEARMVMMVLNLYNYDVVVKKHRWSPQWRLTRRRDQATLWSCCCPMRPYRSSNHDDTHDDHHGDVLRYGDKVFVRFSHKKCYGNSQPDPFVYTLSVDQDHSFAVNGYVVKNCGGLTPDTMVLTENLLVPICQLQPGDFVLDKTYQKRQIRNVLKSHYEGNVVSLYQCCSYTVSTHAYLKNKTDAEPIGMVQDPSDMASPVLCYYYHASIDQTYSIHVLNFILRYLCDWDIQEEGNDWCHWDISIADQLFLQPILSAFHPFQYQVGEKHLYIKKKPLTSYIEDHLRGLIHISTTKLNYFFSYMDRVGTHRFNHQQSHFCNTIRSFLRTETTTPADVQKQRYVGDIYDLDVEGDGFCTSGAMIQKDFKTQIGSPYWEHATHLYIPDGFFQNIHCEGGWDQAQQQQVSDIWQDIVHRQRVSGKPSIICADRNQNECVSGDTRILTYHGVVPISSKKDEIVSVWNGTQFTDVMITRTGREKKFLKLSFSNGLCLTCTPYHKLFIVSKTSQKVLKLNASDILCGDVIAPFQLPSVSSIDVLPSSVVMTLEWIAKRCVHMEKDVVLFERDIESLKDILLDLQYCGLNSRIVFNPHRDEYELRLDKTRWNLLNYRHLNKNVSHTEGDVVRDLHVVRVEETQKYQESYCFHEPFSGTSIFEGVATGQCENLSDMVCVQGHVDVSRFLKTNPFRKQLQHHKVIVYTTKECPFLRWLRLEHEDLDIRLIEIWEDEWRVKRHIHALSSVPAIFLDNLYVGNFMDFWKHYLCPVLDTEMLRQSVYALCHGLDNAIDQEKQQHILVNEFCFLSNRPLLLRVQGFWEVLLRMKLSIGEAETQQLNKVIFETIHYAALKASSDMAAKKGPCVNSDKIYSSFFEASIRAHDNLRQNIMTHGLRNMIYIRTCEPKKRTPQQHLLKCFHGEKILVTDIPNSLRNIYQDDYEICQKELLQLMVDRRKHNVMDEDFHLYVDEQTMTEEELSELQEDIWKQGFHTLHIHHRK